MCSSLVLPLTIARFDKPLVPKLQLGNAFIIVEAPASTRFETGSWSFRASVFPSLSLGTRKLYIV